MPKLHEALAQFATVARAMPGADPIIRPMAALDCSQVEAFTGVLRAIGEVELADSLLAEHEAHDRKYGNRAHNDELPTTPVAPPLPFLIDERIATIRPAVLSTGAELGSIRLVESTTGTLHKQVLNVFGEWEDALELAPVAG